MDDLPLELYLSIFDYLDLNDLLTMRLVCKRIENAVREFRVQELTFLEGSFYSDYPVFPNVWFSSDKTKEQRMLFPFSRNFLSKGPCNVQFLKWLSIRSLRMIEAIDLEEIAKFQHLECLEIGFDLESQKSFSLSLPNLRALKVIEFLHKKQLEIVAPKLQALHLPAPRNFFERRELSREEYLATYLPQLTFRDPQSVRFLSFHTDYFSLPDHPLPHEPYLNQFESVDCMQIQHAQQIFSSTPDFEEFNRVVRLDQALLKFPNLKRVHCNALTSVIKRLDLAKLIAQLRDFELPGLKVYSNGIELSDDPTLTEDFNRFRRPYVEKDFSCKWDRRLSGRLILQLSHYSKLEDRVRSTEWIDYSELGVWLRSSPSRGLAVDFFERFPCIRGIRVTSRIGDPDALASFVKNCHKLKELSLSGSELGQAFCDELPVVSSLNFLEIEEANDLNMQFVLRMNRLGGLTTNQQLTTEIARNFFSTRFGHELQGKIQCNSVKSIHFGGNCFSLKVDGETIKKQLTLEYLIEQFSSFERRRSSDDGPPLKSFKSSVGS